MVYYAGQRKVERFQPFVKGKKEMISLMAITVRFAYLRVWRRRGPVELLRPCLLSVERSQKGADPPALEVCGTAPSPRGKESRNCPWLYRELFAETRRYPVNRPVHTDAIHIKILLHAALTSHFPFDEQTVKVKSRQCHIWLKYVLFEQPPKEKYS